MSPYIIFNNFGAGAESCVGILLWIRRPETRPIDPYTGEPVTLDQIVTLTALTGLEYESTKAQVEKYIFPEMCEHNMRMIQVGRGGQSFDDLFHVLILLVFSNASIPKSGEPHWR